MARVLRYPTAFHQLGTLHNAPKLPAKATEKAAELASREMDLGDWAQEAPGKKPKPSGRARGGKLYDKALTLGRELMKNPPDNWQYLQALQAVGLYIALHEAVYEVQPEELRGEAMLGAISAAGKLMGELGGGGVVRFLRWTWARERKRQKRDDLEPRRIGWRLQFVHRGLLTDWKMMARKAGR